MERVRTIARWALGGALLVAGASHLTTQREEFRAQVPEWFSLDHDAVVLTSGVVELALGVGLLLVRDRRVVIGMVVAGFFVAVFPGNIAQWREGTDAFGLDTDTKRFVRLLFQPLLVLWALWSTGVAAEVARRRR